MPVTTREIQEKVWTEILPFGCVANESTDFRTNC